MAKRHDYDGKFPFFDVEIDLEDDELIRKQTLSILESLKPDWDLENLNFKVFSGSRFYRFILRPSPMVLRIEFLPFSPKKMTMRTVKS